MATAIATFAELQSRLDWVLDSGEQGVANGVLEDLSDDARYYGSEKWDSSTAPRQVKSLVLRAAARFMRNPDGYTQSRAGDETLMWSDQGENAGTAYFNEREQKMLAALANRSNQAFGTAQVVAWGPTKGYHDQVGYVPAAGGLFPFYADGNI